MPLLLSSVPLLLSSSLPLLFLHGQAATVRGSKQIVEIPLIHENVLAAMLLALPVGRDDGDALLAGLRMHGVTVKGRGAAGWAGGRGGRREGGTCVTLRRKHFGPVAFQRYTETSPHSLARYIDEVVLQ